MGTGDSKEKPAPEVDKSISEESSGFHVFELHMPSVGMSFGWLLFVIFLAGVLYLVAKWARRRIVRKRRVRVQIPPSGGFPPAWPGWPDTGGNAYPPFVHPGYYPGPPVHWLPGNARRVLPSPSRFEELGEGGPQAAGRHSSRRTQAAQEDLEADGRLAHASGLGQ